ncbi:DM13 domain-containing protein [Plantactinospora sp. GCM10030261]|uniref:DM13 domain-containing protein n=1 Tax=Plantactinospora sp. GCM10030261 TaxID=3273420 RepID=UPI00360DFAFC
MVVRLLRSPLTWAVVVVLAIGAAIGLYWFQPWKLVTDTTVAESLSTPAPPPSATSGPPGSPGPSGTPEASAPGPTGSPAAGPVLLSQGGFVTHEHDTSGTARIVRLPDGSRRLELVNFSTSNGPDLRIWLTDQPVREGQAGWRVFDDGRWVELGRLKGNKGNQAYLIPAGVDLTGLGSVSIWCKRFAVSFGAASLRPA